MRRFIVALVAIATILGGLMTIAPAASAAPASAHMAIPSCAGGPGSSPGTNQKPLVRPKILGEMKVGSTIRTSTGKWPWKGLNLSTTWYRISDGKKVFLCHGYEYKIKKSDIGHKIVAYVEAFGTRPLTQYGSVYTRPRLVQ